MVADGQVGVRAAAESAATSRRDERTGRVLSPFLLLSFSRSLDLFRLFSLSLLVCLVSQLSLSLSLSVV